jgi:hypothetical protein
MHASRRVLALAAAAAAVAAAAAPALRPPPGARDASATHAVELMSHEEVMALHANFTRARELQSVPVGTEVTLGACARARERAVAAYAAAVWMHTCCRLQ